MSKHHFYHVKLPGGREATVAGGPLKPSTKAGYVVLTMPTGEPLFELPARCVKETTLEETAARMAADSKAKWN